MNIGGPLPLPVVHSASEPFQAAAFCQIVPGDQGCAVTIYQVPPGRRAVIENFSGFGRGAAVKPYLATIVGATIIKHYLPTPNINEHSEGSYGALVRLYAEPGSEVGAGADNFGGGIAVVEFSFSGYLIPAP